MYILLGTTIDHHENLSFTFQELKNRKQLAVTLTDIDFAEDIAVASDNIPDDIALQNRVEEAVRCYQMLSFSMTKTK